MQPYSLHDGPGIRTVIFMKGCPLRCPWCSNPESQKRQPEVYLDDTKCIRSFGCDLCDGICSWQALKAGSLNHALCTACGSCTDVCPAKAIGIYGEKKGAGEILDRVERESVFYAHGQGGMTLSGGEPFLQGAFALELLREAKKRRIHTAVETCGYCDAENFKRSGGISGLHFLRYQMYGFRKTRSLYWAGEYIDIGKCVDAVPGISLAP